MTELTTASAQASREAAEPSTATLPPPPQAGAASVFALPTPKRTTIRLLRGWLIGLVVFGFGPAITYGWLVWLLNEEQWRWAYLMYVTEVPLIGGLCVLAVPYVRYQLIRRALIDWMHGQPVDRARCAAVYERALRLPFWVATGAGVSVCVGYLIGTSVVHWQANQPVVEMLPKTLPAIPLVGGMMGAFGYFATSRALHPVVSWCSLQLRRARPTSHMSLGTKFLITTCVLAIGALCLLQPAAYTLGQVITEQHMRALALMRLEVAAHQVALFDRRPDQIQVLRRAVIGSHDYVFAMDPAGHLLTPHPRGYTNIANEHLYQLAQHLQGSKGAWVDRVGQHRVVAFVHVADPPWTLVAISFPTDFSAPLHRFMQFSWITILEVLFVVVLFGRYFTRGITTPLAELTRAAERIAEHGDLTQHVPVTTNDELGELARSFNRMVEELQASKANLEDYTKRLERSTQELSALNQEMEDLLRVVSHDLRAPLINIQGFSKRLEPVMANTLQTLDRIAGERQADGFRTQVEALKARTQTQFAESLRFISKGVEKMDALLSSLLAVSRVGRKADPLQPNDLNAILDDVLATFDHQIKEHAIQIIRHPLPTRIPCRRNEINQVFSNLVSNAISYMGPFDRRFIEVGATEHEDHVECYVKDTGIGISPEDHERVFQMFTRLQAVDAPGEGIGLAYVKKILRSHGGRIWVTSQRGQGSIFFFTLPTRLPSPIGGQAQPLEARG